MTQDEIVGTVIFTIIGVALIIASLRWPNIARGFAGFGFIAAGIVNLIVAWTNPESYVDAYGPTAILGIYEDLIEGAFARHTTLFVSLIAIGQLISGLLMLLRGNLAKLGLMGGIIFLLAFVPLGTGSAFPSPLLLAFALLILLRQNIDETMASLLITKWRAVRRNRSNIVTRM